MEARYTKARKEASDLSYLVAILRNHLIFWKNTPPDGVPYTGTSLPAMDRKRCFWAESHSWPCDPKYIPESSGPLWKRLFFISYNMFLYLSPALNSIWLEKKPAMPNIYKNLHAYAFLY